MKKNAIAIIALIFTAFVFGSCEMQKGGTIRVTNESDKYTVNIYITNSATLDLDKPPANYLVKTSIGVSGTTEIKIDEDGTYYVKPFFLILEGTTVEAEILGTPSPALGLVTLLAGSTSSVTVTPIIK